MLGLGLGSGSGFSVGILDLLFDLMAFRIPSIKIPIIKPNAVIIDVIVIPCSRNKV